MGTIVSFFTSALGGIWGYVAAAGIAAVLATGGTFYVVHRMDEATIAKMELADEQAKVAAVKEAAAITQSQDKVDLDAAVDEARAQQVIATRTRTVTREITIHVPQTQPCIPYGLVRVLDDAATGSNSADAPAPAGEPDDACSGISWRSFASDLTDDYGTGRQNAEQLNALEGNVTALVNAANVP